MDGGREGASLTVITVKCDALQNWCGWLPPGSMSKEELGRDGGRGSNTLFIFLGLL